MRATVIAVAGFAALFSMGQAAAADGKGVYEKACAACHSALSPKLTGEKAKWDALLKAGKPALVASVIKGKGAMPPKGGAGSDADVKAALDYMVTQIK